LLTQPKTKKKKSLPDSARELGHDLRQTRTSIHRNPPLLVAAPNKVPLLNVNHFLHLKKQLPASTQTKFEVNDGTTPIFPGLSPAMVLLVSYSLTFAKAAARSYYSDWTACSLCIFNNEQLSRTWL
jgi:hypothetical protein